MGWSIPILRVAGIQLRIHITFLLLIAWIAFAYYTHGGSSAAVGGVLFILLLFGCVVLRVRARFGWEGFRNQHA